MNLYRRNLDRARKEGPRHTVIQSSEIADGSCMSPKRFLGGECDHYLECKYRLELDCEAEHPPDWCDECGDSLMGDEETLCTPCEEYARKAKP